MPSPRDRQTSPLQRELHATAVFMPKTDARGHILHEARQRDGRVTVHFNPETLEITCTNTIQKGRRNQPAQVTVTETTAKLSMELIFDTTLNGVDVRTETIAIARLMDPAQQTPRRRNARERKIPSIVVFQWGTIWFEGYIDSYREKIDFFSSQGVPLRATLTLSLTQQQRSFDPNEAVDYDRDRPRQGDLQPAANAAIERLAENDSVTALVQSGGNPEATRRAAEMNGIENPRHPEVEELVLAERPERRPPALTGIMSAPPTAMPASPTEALFAQLHHQAREGRNAAPRRRLAPSEPPPAAAGERGPDPRIGLGGKAVADAAAALADVGIDADLRPGILFEE